MLTKDVSDELESVLKSLQAQGKEPTVALVKARMGTPVPMPALIAAIRSWKNANKVPKIEVADTTQQNPDRVALLEQQIAALTARISALETKLSEK
ncbi:hypothetical protein L4C33_06980 [Vibrio makurazakiensis]|uniref:hypothetical protein n=1 Tax=Vibrio makurazakiensis TaxID=2910250 RepID=UPI003D0E426C